MPPTPKIKTAKILIFILGGTVKLLIKKLQRREVRKMEKIWFIFVLAYAISTMFQSWIILWENIKLIEDNKRLESNNQVLKNHIERIEKHLKTESYDDVSFI